MTSLFCGQVNCSCQATFPSFLVFALLLCCEPQLEYFLDYNWENFQHTRLLGNSLLFISKNFCSSWGKNEKKSELKWFENFVHTKNFFPILWDNQKIRKKKQSKDKTKIDVKGKKFKATVCECCCYSVRFFTYTSFVWILFINLLFCGNNILKHKTQIYSFNVLNKIIKTLKIHHLAPIKYTTFSVTYSSVMHTIKIK